VLRFGGEKALTKQAPDEIALKCHMPLDEANKIVGNTSKLLENNAFAFLDSEEGVKTKRAMAKTRMGSLRSRLGKIMRRLYDLESGNEPEKTLKIEFDVDLYQMENF
jgi:nucleotidyltransferase/DNA polymerase involved in DNA repair